MTEFRRSTAASMDTLMPLTVNAVTRYTLDTIGGRCPACKTPFDSSDLLVNKREIAEENALELALHGSCRQCRAESVSRLRYVASHKRIDKYRWCNRHQHWELVGWKNAARQRATSFGVGDLLCMLLPCMVFPVLPSAYQSTPNFVGLFLMAYVASRLWRAIAS